MAETDRSELRKAAEQSFIEKKQILADQINYYPNKIKEKGFKTINRFRDYYPESNRLMDLGVVFAQEDLESVAEAMQDKTPWAVVSGLNPSGPLHFGHKIIFDNLLWLQKQGADIYIPITNDETYVVDKAKSLGESRRIAYEEVIPSIIAMGFDPKKTHIFVDSDYPQIYNLAMKFSKHLSNNKINGVFGFGNKRKEDGDDLKEEKENPGTYFYRGAIQQAQILLPQIKEFGGPKPTIIPVGIDQYPYILLARDVAEKAKLIPPAALFLTFADGLDGKGKMSASRRESAIFLNDEPQVAAKKIKTAYTGGSVSAEFQREHGGVPEICPIYQLRTYNFEKDKHVAEDCKNGQILCGDCKRITIEQVIDFLVEHQAKLPEARDRINEFLLTTPITSHLD